MFSLRHGRPLRLALAGAVILATTLTFAPARAFPPPVLHDTSVQRGWASNTIILPAGPPCSPTDGDRCFDPNDPPYRWADGQIRFLLSRWDDTLCTTTSTVSVTDAGGNPVAGTLTFESFDGNPDRVMRFTVSDPAYPHGLAAGRSALPAGGGAPFTVTWTAYSDFIVCDVVPTTVTQKFGLDRKLPLAPSLTSPSPTMPVGVVSGPVTVAGTVADPWTKPNDTNEFGGGGLETSGINSVVIRLYDAGPLCVLQGGCFLKSYEVVYPCTTKTHLNDPTIPRCNQTESFSFTIPSGDLAIGGRYSIDAYAMDRAGRRNPVASSQDNNPDDQHGPAAPARTFVWLG